MLNRISSRLTYANVMATLALFIALGGGAYAAIKLPANSVGTKQIRNKAVTPRKLSPAAIALFKGQKGDAGPTGPIGPVGPAGPRGADGTNATSTPLTSEPWHVVGTSGEPAYGAGWTTFPHTHDEATADGLGTWDPNAPAAQFYKDALGIVHIRGWVVNTAGSGFVVFTLPAGYCPDATFITDIALDSPLDYHSVNIGAGSPDCNVLSDVPANKVQYLDGIEFRAG
jgi:hypothetical protein